MTSTLTPGDTRVTFRDVFAVGEYRALWAAQLASMAGDQFARLALTVLVYQRTGSAALAAGTFAVALAAQFTGALGLSWAADRYPRRRVMIGADLACLAGVLVMLIPGLPAGVLVALLFLVSMAFAPFLAARMAVNRAVLGDERFALGTGITQGTNQVAQLAGFALAGLVVAAAGVRAALVIDAASFAASAAIIRARVRPHRPRHPGAARPARPEIWAGARVVFASPAARTAMLLMWCAAFYNAPEGITVPLAASLGGGTAAAGALLAAMTAGASAGLLGWNRFAPAAWRTRLLAVMALGASLVLTAFAASPPLAGALVILAASGLFTGYLASAGAVLFGQIPDHQRGQASGLLGAGMSLGQGAAIVAAGAAAGVWSPALVIAGCGLAGAAAAIPLGLRWHRLGMLL